MLITHPLRLDLNQRQSLPPIPVVQEDSCSRQLALSLYSEGEAWPIPEGVSPMIRYRKSDGTGGSYDTLPDGSLACAIDGNTITCILAPQVCAAPGPVQLAVSLLLGSSILSTFHVELLVQDLPTGEADSQDYHYATAFLPQPGMAQAGQVLVVQEAAQNGTVLGLQAADPQVLGMGAAGGYYIPSVQQVNSTTISLEFTASQEAMEPKVLSFLLQLPTTGE